MGVDAALRFLKKVSACGNSRYTHDDVGAGYLLADYCKPFARPCPERRCWMVYDGIRWQTDAGAKTVEAAAKDVSRALALYAATLSDGDMRSFAEWSAKWSKSGNRKVYLYEATSVHGVSMSDFDRHGWLLNCLNGTIDLRTGELLPHRQEDLLTQCADAEYIKDAKCERWESFVREVMSGDAEKARFVQTFLGWCLIGDTSAECFAILYGPSSRNGKSVLIGTVQRILGDYARAVSAETITSAKQKDGRAPSENVARLAGVRLAVVGEIPQGAKLDAALVKSMTGGDTLNARYLGENSFDFKPQFKLVLHTNHLPSVSDISVFDSGRAIVIPFDRHFAPDEQDRGLERLFFEHRSAVLAWLVQGAILFRSGGLKAPEAVKMATAAYRLDNDLLTQFAAGCLGAGEAVPIKKVHAMWTEWCAERGIPAENVRWLRRGLQAAGWKMVRKRIDGGNPIECVKKGEER